VAWNVARCSANLDHVTDRTDAVAEMALAAMQTLVDPDPLAPPRGLGTSDLYEWDLASIPDLEARWRELSGDDGWRRGSGLQFRFATVRLQKAGLMYRQGKKWWATGLGRDALNRHPDPAAFYAEAGKAYSSGNGTRPALRLRPIISMRCRTADGHPTAASTTATSRSARPT
jgi:5-methylcytosine-specific restriction protein B